MLDPQYIAFEENGQIYQVQLEPKGQSSDESPFDEARGVQSSVMNQMQQAQNLIRFYAKSVVDAFKELGEAEVSEFTLKFGLKIGGQAGIPYVTQGTADSHFDIEVKCKFPDKTTNQ